MNQAIVSLSEDSMKNFNTGYISTCSISINVSLFSDLYFSSMFLIPDNSWLKALFCSLDFTV